MSSVTSTKLTPGILSSELPLVISEPDPSGSTSTRPATREVLDREISEAELVDLFFRVSSVVNCSSSRGFVDVMGASPVGYADSGSSKIRVARMESRQHRRNEKANTQKENDKGGKAHLS